MRYVKRILRSMFPMFNNALRTLLHTRIGNAHKENAEADATAHPINETTYSIPFGFFFWKA